MNLKFIKPQNLGSLLMKSSQSNFKLRLSGSYLVRSYLITTVTLCTFRVMHFQWKWGNVKRPTFWWSQSRIACIHLAYFFLQKKFSVEFMVPSTYIQRDWPQYDEKCTLWPHSVFPLRANKDTIECGEFQQKKLKKTNKILVI